MTSITSFPTYPKCTTILKCTVLIVHRNCFFSFFLVVIIDGCGSDLLEYIIMCVNICIYLKLHCIVVMKI